MQKRKGFTLVELVIVIAVIAILAGVLIGTFASVLSKAQESARMQEIKAQEHEQKADDLLKKIENSNWYGWEDFETSIVEKITAAIDKASKDKQNEVNVKIDSASVQKAVSEAMAKYYAENAMGNTALTQEQVKAIVENALGSFKYEGVTKAQVESVVNAAVSKMSTGLTAQQVKTIVNAAAEKVEANQLTVGQITTIVANAFAQNKVDTTGLATSAQVEAIVTAINNKQCSTLTAQQVEDIVTAVVGNAGSTAWVTPESYATEEKFTLETADDIKGLATLVNGGYDFEDKVVELQGTTQTIKVGGVDTQVENVIKLDGQNWTPIGSSYETQFEGKIVSADTTKPLVVDGLTLDEQFNAVLNGILINCSSTGNMDKVGVGFVAYLGEDATLENITFTNVNINITDARMDGISIGAAVGYLDGGTIKNVKVESGTISAVYRVGGLCGAAGWGTIEGCEIGATVSITSTGIGATNGNTSNKALADGPNTYYTACGLIGYTRQFTKGRTAGVTVTDTKVLTTNITSYGIFTNVSNKQDAWIIGNDYNHILTVGTGTTENKLVADAI